MIISEKFKHFTAEWDMNIPDNILIDAYDVSYDIDADMLIAFALKIKAERQQIQSTGGALNEENII